MLTCRRRGEVGTQTGKRERVLAGVALVKDIDWMKKTLFFFFVFFFHLLRNHIDHGGGAAEGEGQHIQFLSQGCCIGGHAVSSSSSGRMLRRWPDQSGGAEGSIKIL